MKKTIILIHGYLTDYHDFSNLPKYLIEKYDYVVELSIPGHGKYNNMKNFKVKNTIKIVEDEVQFYLKKGTVDLVGYSMGGALSRYLASKFQNIGHLVLLTPATQYISFTFLFNRTRHLMSEKSTFKEKYSMLLEHDILFVKTLLSGPIYKLRLKHCYTFVKLIQTINKQRQTFDVPTLIVYGLLDELVPKRAVKYCYDCSTSENKQIIYYEDMGHSMLYSHRQQDIIDKIMDFLK